MVEVKFKIKMEVNTEVKFNVMVEVKVEVKIESKLRVKIQFKIEVKVPCFTWKRPELSLYSLDSSAPASSISLSWPREAVLPTSGFEDWEIWALKQTKNFNCFTPTP